MSALQLLNKKRKRTGGSTGLPFRAPRRHHAVPRASYRNDDAAEAEAEDATTGEDVEDYMSASFLVDTKAPSEDTAGGAGKRRKKAKREPRLPPPPKKKLHEHMQETRDSGLAKPIPKSNIGHRLLMKMGYKEGSGLGKREQGTAAPIDVVVKANKGGLGRDTHIAERREMAKKFARRQAEVRARYVVNKRATFQSTLRAKYAAREDLRNLKKCKSVCENLDREIGVTDNPIWFVTPEDGDIPQGPLNPLERPGGNPSSELYDPYQRPGGTGSNELYDPVFSTSFDPRELPPGPTSSSNSSSQPRRSRFSEAPPTQAPRSSRFSEAPPTQAQRPSRFSEAPPTHVPRSSRFSEVPQQPTHAPRSSRFSEVPRSGKFSENPPAPTYSAFGGDDRHPPPMPGGFSGRQSHPSSVPKGDVEEDSPEVVREKLEDALTYLRDVHSYCIFCGHRYDNGTDLASNCPGRYDDDH